MFFSAPPAGGLFAARRSGAVVASFVALLVHAAGAAAADVSTEYKRRIETAENISALTDNLFGDQVSLYNGQTSFSVTDIDVPGNSSLPVRLTRLFDVELRITGGGSPSYDDSLGGAGNWTVDVPYISGRFAAEFGWRHMVIGGDRTDNRCSTRGVPGVPAGFDTNDIWQGNSIHIPGERDRNMLQSISGVPQPEPGRNWSTIERDAIRCIPMISGLEGEGFEVTTSSGIRYEFNHAVARTTGVLTRSVAPGLSPASSVRVRIYLLATKVTDRFGNTVEYDYNSNGHPTRIWSNDDRVIELTYSGTRLQMATIVPPPGTTARSWGYEYSSSHPDRLVRVEQPDDTAWGYAYSNDLVKFAQPWTEGNLPGCQNFPPKEVFDFTLTAEHPSGAKGAFHFANSRMFRSGIHAIECVEETVDGERRYYLGTPNLFDVMALRTKEITGETLPAPLVWSYSYGSVPQQLYNFNQALGACTSQAVCPQSKGVSVTRPDMSRMSYSFGVVNNHNEGRLLATSVVGPDGTVLRRSVMTHLTDAEADDQAFFHQYGGVVSGESASAGSVRPVVEETVTQDGVTFVRRVEDNCGSQYCFDEFARPIKETRASSLGYSRTDVSTYHDSMSKWVLGQLSKQTLVASSPVLGSQPVVSETLFDANAMPKTLKSFGQVQQELTYHVSGDQAGALKTLKDGRGFVTNFSRWYRGVPRTITYPPTNAFNEQSGGATTKAEVDGNGWVVETTDENNYIHMYDHDLSGRQTLVIYPSGDKDQWLDTETTHERGPAKYGLSATHFTSTKSTGDMLHRVHYDELWRPVVEESMDVAAETTTRSIVVKRYGADGLLEFESYPRRTLGSFKDTSLKGTRFTYDSLGRITRMEWDVDDDGVEATTTQYLSGFRVAAKNARAFVTTTEYMAWDQPTYDFPVRISAPEGTLTVISRDTFGKPTSIERSGPDG